MLVRVSRKVEAIIYRISRKEMLFPVEGENRTLASPLDRSEDEWNLFST